MSWQENVLPRDVIAQIYYHVLQLTAKRCPRCNRAFMWEMRNTDMKNMQLTCKHFYKGWKRFVLLMLRSFEFMCAVPRRCLTKYISAAPPIPFLLLRPQKEEILKAYPQINRMEL